jgi:hypothetical protein
MRVYLLFAPILALEDGYNEFRFCACKCHCDIGDP